MPLNGGGTASKPPGTTFVPNTTVSSAPMNSVLDDIYAIFNTPRPIVYGGTNGASAVEGGDNLSTKGADIPSATTTDIGASTGRFVHITGTTPITGLGTKTAGVVRFVVFDGVLTLTHNATSLILPGAANITTAAGDGAVFVSEGAGNWRCIDYIRASGLPVVSTSGLQGYLFGLNATTNTGTPASNIDISTGVAAKFDSPYTLITLASAITKNTANAWAVGNNNGSLDTGAIANSQYYGYEIQRSDTGVTDVLTSLSSTAPTMPTNYDRRSQALFTFVRNAGVNGLPVPMPLNRVGWIKVAESIPVSAVATIDFLGILTSVYDRYRIEVDQVGNVTNTTQLRMLVSTNGGSTWLSAGYLQGVLASAASVAQTGENNLAYWGLTQDIINTAGNGANGHVELTRLAGALAMESHMAGVTTGSTLRFEVQSGLLSGTIDSIRFLYSAGNIASGSRIRVYALGK